MNKIYLLTAAFAVMASLSGCSDTELASIDTAQEKTPIGFHTVGSKMGSRATIINPADITKTDFRVFAFTKNDADDNDNISFMGGVADETGHKGVTIKYNSKWDYANASDCHYWPETTPLNFYAISPGTYDFTSISYSWNIAKDSKTITYTSFDEYVNTTNPSSLDLMYAVAKNQVKSENAGKVNLQFKHILSQIVFQAKTKYENMQVDIKDVFIHNAYRKGTFTFPSSTEPSQSNWGTDDFAYGKSTCIIKEKNIVVNSNKTAEDISSKNPSLFIPQILTAWKPEEKNKEAADAAKLSYLEINCRIQQNGVYVFGKDGYKTLYVPFSASWEPGKRYVYTLIFGGGYTEESQQILTPITFDASVGNWVNDAGNSTTGNDIPLYQ